MQVTPTSNAITTPQRQMSVFSRSSSTTAGASSSRLSLHLHSSLLHTPPTRTIRTPAGTTTTTTTTTAMAAGDAGEGIALPLLPSAEFHPFLPHSGRLERQHSSRHGLTARSEEEAPSAAELERVEAEATDAAVGMSREELENAVNELYTSNRMLQNTILLEREDLTKMREGLRETYEAAEKEGESITNQLTRRVDAVRRQKAELEAQLHREETLKAEQERKLLKLKLDSSNLARVLRREEEETLAEKKKELYQLQQQRQQLESLLSEESSSLHQLQEFVDVLQPQTSGSATGRSGSNASNDNDNNYNKDDSSATAHSSDMDKNSATGAAKPVLHATPSPPRCGGTEYTDPASDPEEMLQYLKHGISVVEALQREACERGRRYEQERQELERRISQAERERRSNRHSLEGIHQELVETTATVTELASVAESGRHLHEGGAGSVPSGSHGSSSQSESHTYPPCETASGAAQGKDCQHACTNSSGSTNQK